MRQTTLRQNSIKTQNRLELFFPNHPWTKQNGQIRQSASLRCMLLSQYAGAHTMAVLKIQGIRDKIVMFGPLSHRREGYNHRGPSSQGPGQF